MPHCPTCNAELPDDGAVCPRCVTLTEPHDLAEHLTLVTSEGASQRGTGLESIAHFRILRELGAGGMGTVYLAYDERMNRQVALKVMSRHQSPETADRRFEQEAWIAGRLDHPNIVKVYERGQWEELSFYAMELVDGGSLADVIGRMKRGGRDDTLGMTTGTHQYVHWVVRTMIDAARGLDFAHREGIVHRDVKPVNLLLNRSLSTVKIADFGIAVDIEATRMTRTGTVLGTLLYMAPEQIRGETRQIDARTDVYALGVTLFESITLQMPYTGKTQQLYMSQILTVESQRARKINARVSRDLDTVLSKAMEKAPADRYQTAAAFADDLENVLNLRPIEARPAGALKRTTKWIRRKPVHAALAATLIVGVPAAALIGIGALRERVAARKGRIADLLDEARWLGQREDYASMRERAAEVLELEPGNVMALRHRAMARFRLGEREQALVDADGVIAASPKAAWPHTLKAWMLTQLKRPEEAAVETRQASGLRAEPPSDEDVGEEARLASAREEHRQAVDLYSELIRRHPDSARAVSARAQAYESLGRRDDALVDYRVSVGLDPEYDLALIGIARLSADAGRLEDAEAFAKRAIAIDPDNPFALETQGMVLIRRGQEAKAKGDAAQAVRYFTNAEAASQAALQRSDALLWAGLNLATAIAERARVKDDPDPDLMSQAIARYQKVLQGFPEIPETGQPREVYVAAQLNLCDAQIAMRRLQEAIASCSNITRLSPDDPLGFYNLAGAHALSGHREDALAALARDVELGDNDWGYLSADPWFESLRGDHRFADLVAAMKRKAP